MKRIMLAVGLGLLSGSLYASCFGPFCYDDTGFSIGGVASNGNGHGMPQMTKAQVAAATPTAKGQVIFCTNCTSFANQLGYLCISTATTQSGYMAISSATAVSACN